MLNYTISSCIQMLFTYLIEYINSLKCRHYIEKFGFHPEQKLPLFKRHYNHTHSMHHALPLTLTF